MIYIPNISISLCLSADFELSANGAAKPRKAKRRPAIRAAGRRTVEKPMCETKSAAQTKMDRLLDVLERLIERLGDVITNAEQRTASGGQKS